MIRLIILFFGIALFFNFTKPVNEVPMSSSKAWMTQDTVPFRVDKALIQELSRQPQAKTWRDSGYYFQFENIFWQAVRFGTTQNGDIIMLTTFSSADPASLQFQGRAVFRFSPKDIPSDITPSRGMQGTAMIAFPQDVLYCPSPSQEVGLGQNDPYFPLYLSGEMTGIDAAGGNFLYFETPMSVQLRDMEVIL
jgi:hypothetical protein